MGTSLRPRIGITSYREPAAWGAWHERADLLAAEYAEAVEAAGGVPLLLPAVAADPEGAARSVLEGVHGLVLAGGHDIDSDMYGQARHPSADEPRCERDRWEMALLRAAFEQETPLLAICRGLQILNVCLGGTLHQHLPEVVGSVLHRPTLGEFSPHEVTFDASSLAGRIYGDRSTVPAHHHQGIDGLAPTLVATAWTEDGLVEAVERPGEQWVLGVQWHPEAGGGAALFSEFVAQAARFRAAFPRTGHDPVSSASPVPA